MKRNNENLILALAKFAEDWWLPYNDSISMLSNAIENGMISKRDLVKNLIEAINDVNFDWIDLAKESQLLIIPEAYTNKEIKNYAKFLLYDYLIPEKIITKEELDNLNIAVENLLQKHTSNDGWILAYDLFDELKKQDQFVDLEYYNLWKLPFINRQILQRSIQDKDREIGYLKYNTKLSEPFP
ncbi:hypothetical protein IRZ71_09620 [Flavobacterium sp. ANB]|uniref:hypothetical protein n=1 Tax=unclassified Flavobacterium TaxID=196869 RepID=UPI0012B8EA3A|nr:MULTISPECIES: hypothetical protein [unclassified Flavobacterium]MBF4516604.1 hypothetical protein [Flavobacterium sp. ANB]MTD69499.1 hypothetical protein [Flavobacterium sp. LC2016-13]